MKSSRSLALLTVLSIGLASFRPASAAVLRGLVTEVLDGETVSVQVSNHVVKVRLCAVSTPHDNSTLAQTVRLHLAVLIKGKEIAIEYSAIDQDGSIIGTISTGQMDVGMQMIRDGAALYNRANANDLPEQYRRLYEESEQAARNEKRGIWQSGSAPTRDESEPADDTSLGVAKTPAQSAAKLNDEGYHLIQDGNYPAALPRIREALKLDPKLAAAHKNLALIFCDTGRYQDALPEGQEALKLDPSSDKAHNVMGKILFGLGDDSGSIREYKEAIRLNPKYAKAHYNLGVTFLRDRQFMKALAAFHEAEQLAPNQPAVQVDSGIALYFLGRRAEARALWQKVLTMGDPVAAMLAEENLNRLPK